MADRKNFADYFGIPVNKIPPDTKFIPDPKRFVINLAQLSNKRKIKDIIPQGIGSQGPGYNTIMQEFVENLWNPKNALNHNRSLHKAIQKLTIFLK